MRESDNGTGKLWNLELVQTIHPNSVAEDHAVLAMNVVPPAFQDGVDASQRKRKHEACCDIIRSAKIGLATMKGDKATAQVNLFENACVDEITQEITV